MIIKRFGDDWASAFVLSQFMAEDEFNISRPPVLTPVGGMGGSFDHWAGENFPLESALANKKLSLSAPLYRLIDTNLGELKLATVGRGRSRLWREHRDGLLRQWAWAKCIGLDTGEKAGQEYLDKEVSLRFSLPEGLWYGEFEHQVTLTSADTMTLYNAGDYPAMLRAVLGAGSLSDSIDIPSSAFTVTASTADPAQSFTLIQPGSGGLQRDDVMIAFIAVSGLVATDDVRAPEDWTFTERAVAAGLTVFLYQRTAEDVADEPDDYTWLSTAAVNWAGGITAFRGASPGSILNVLNLAYQANASSTSCDAPSISTDVNNSWLVVVGAAAGAVTFTAPGGMTERGDVASSDGSNNVSIALFTELQATAGATGTRTATLSGAQVNVGIAIELFAAGDALSLPTLTNQTTGRQWSYFGLIGFGERLVVNPATYTVTLGIAGQTQAGRYARLLPNILPANISASTAWIWLAPGANTIDFGGGSLTQPTLDLFWYDTYL